MGLPALGLGQPGRILTASAIYTPFDGSSLQLKVFERSICYGYWSRSGTSNPGAHQASNAVLGLGVSLLGGLAGLLDVLVFGGSELKPG